MDLTLHLAGPLRITGPEGAALNLSRRAQALLAFLACQPAMRAERALLADLLWSDRGEAQARASLRQELSVLRRHLPERLLGADRQAVWLDPARVALERSGQGAFLQGFDLGSEGFEDWLRDARAAEPGRPAAAAADDTGRPVLAVLPFDEIGVAQDDMFADGIVEEITGALSRVREFDVIARQSAFALKGERLSAEASAARLGAGYLVEGSVRRAGDRVRISVQLVRGGDGHTLWAERFDDRLDDLFDLQDRIAGQVAGQVSPSLRQAEIDRVRTTPPEDRSAYDLLLAGLPLFWAHRAEDNARALNLFDAAVARDPGYAHAWAMKAWCHGQACCYIWSGDPAAERGLAVAAAERAARLAGDHAPTLVAICAALSLTTLERARAESFVDRALEIDPNNAWGWLRKGWVNTLNNSPEVALQAFDRAESLSPLDPFRFNVLFGRANCLAEMQRFDEATELMKRGMNLAPGLTWAYRMLASYHAQAGRMDEARAALATFNRHYPDLTMAKLRAAMAPSIFETQPFYVEGLRKAGMPEE